MMSLFVWYKHVSNINARFLISVPVCSLKKGGDLFIIKSLSKNSQILREVWVKTQLQRSASSWICRRSLCYRVLCFWVVTSSGGKNRLFILGSHRNIQRGVRMERWKIDIQEQTSRKHSSFIFVPQTVMYICLESIRISAEKMMECFCDGLLNGSGFLD